MLLAVKSSTPTSLREHDKQTLEKVSTQYTQESNELYEMQWAILPNVASIGKRSNLRYLSLSDFHPKLCDRLAVFPASAAGSSSSATLYDAMYDAITVPGNLANSHIL